MTPSFEEMVEAAARYRFEGNRGYHYSHGSRVVREVLTAAGVPELLAENERLRVALSACSGFLVGLGDDDVHSPRPWIVRRLCALEHHHGVRCPNEPECAWGD